MHPWAVTVAALVLINMTVWPHEKDVSWKAHESDGKLVRVNGRLVQV